MKPRGRARGPLRKIVAWLMSWDGRCQVQLECGHSVWTDTRAAYRSRCWVCGRIERNECIGCGSSLWEKRCPNEWDENDGTVPPRGKHAPITTESNS